MYTMELPGTTIPSSNIIDAITKQRPPAEIMQLAYSEHVKEEGEVSNEVFGVPKVFVVQHEVLLYGIRNRCIDLIEYILENGYDLHSVNAKRLPTSPMHLACSLGNEEVVKIFVKQGADVHSLAMDPAGQYKPAMAVAMKHDSPNLIKLIIPLYLTKKDMYSRTALHFACDEGAYTCAQYLVKQYPASINVQDFTTYTPLMVSVRQDVRFVRLLLDSGARIQDHTPDKHRQALHLLLCNTIGRERSFLPADTLEIAQLLIERGSDVNRLDKHNETPLSLLCGQVMTELHQLTYNRFPYSLQKHHTVIQDTIKLLLDSGANVNTDSRESPLNVITNGIRAAMEALTGRYRSIVHTGIATEQLQSTLAFSIQMLELLLSRGANPDNINVYFLTPLTQIFVHLHACRYVEKEAWKEVWPSVHKVVHLLLLYGAHVVDIKEAFWHPPYDDTVITMVLNALPQSSYSYQLRIAASRVGDKTIGVPEPVLQQRQWLCRLAQNPRTLRQLARSQVYSMLRYTLQNSVPQLPLPTLLQEYLLSFQGN